MADQLTPEEKLLNVIQQGGAAAGMIGASPASPQEAAGKDTDAIHEVRSGHEHFTGLGILLRALVVLAVLLVVAIGNEFYRAMPDPALTGREIDPPDGGEAAVQIFPDYTTVKTEAAYILSVPDFKPINELNKDQPPPWATYIRRNFNWLGLSPVTDAATSEVVLEAIVMDRKIQKLQLLRQGQRLFISAPDQSGTTQEVLLGAVTKDELLFSADGFELRLNKKQ